MSYVKDRLPVYDRTGELLYYASLEAASRLIESGRALGRGTRNRVRSLVAVRATEESLRSAKPPVGARYSHNRETSENPAGVWTHNLRRCLMYGT